VKIFLFTYGVFRFMELIPLIFIKNRKIYLEKNSEYVSLEGFLELKNENKRLYILDLDGIDKDKPNLCTFQRLSSFYDLWVDFGPRNIGDFVDATMTGVTDLTLRKKLCPQVTIADIKDLIENKIYSNIDFLEETYYENLDGLVNFNSKEDLESNYGYVNYLKKAGKITKIYIYESELKNRSYWENIPPEGFLVDFNKIKEFKNAFRK
jgi:hypothetical protein